MLIDKKITVGQKIWAVPPKQRASNPDPEPIECEVLKVGRKYFEVKPSYQLHKVSIDTLQHEIDSSYKTSYYLTLQEILEEREKSVILGKLKEIFGSYRTPLVTLEQLREINKILGQ